MQNACQPLYLDGANITGRASADVVGKRFVKISGNGTEGLVPVAHAGATDDVWGVSGYNAASGEVLPTIRKGVVPVTAGANLTANQLVQPAGDGSGKAVVYVPATIDATAANNALPLPTKRPAGRVLFDAVSGNDAFIVLFE